MYCNICKSKFLKENLIYKCDKCKFIQKINVVSNEEEKQRYLKHTYDDGYKNYMFNHLKDFLLDKNLNVLDFGCGQMPILHELYPSNYFTYYDKYFYKEDYTNKTYDLILLNEVIEHIINPYDILCNLINLLNKNGYILISTQLYDQVDLSTWWYFRDITHISFFSKYTFIYICEMLNLDYEFQNSFIILRKK